MNRAKRVWSKGLPWGAALSLVLAGCVVPGGYGYDGGVGVDYYEPFGTEYGGWGPGYLVGPGRGGDRRGGDGGGGGHAYRSAAGSRSAPSIPTGGRSGGGSHGGGGGRGR